jgi:hypothetical protein
MEAFGKVHHSQRHYGQWDQMEEKERQLHREEMADLYLMTAERYEHSAIFLHPNPGRDDEVFRLIDLMREKSGDRYFLMMHGDATYSITDAAHMEAFSLRLYDEPEKVKREPERDQTRLGGASLCGGLDGFAMCADSFQRRSHDGVVSEFVTLPGAAHSGVCAWTCTIRTPAAISCRSSTNSCRPTPRPALLDYAAGIDIAGQALYGVRLFIGNVNTARPSTRACVENALLPSTRHARWRLHLLHQQLYTACLSRYELISTCGRRRGLP